MKKLILFLLIGLFMISLVSAESPQATLLQGVIDKLVEIKDILSSMLFELEEISDKETNVIVEPNITVSPPEVNVNPQITVEGENGMAMQGNIILRRSEYVSNCPGSQNNCGAPTEIRITDILYVSLPEGTCDISVSTDCSGCRYSPANSTGTSSGLNCVGNCNGQVIINDEYPLLKIEPNYNQNYNHMYLAYDCE